MYWNSLTTDAEYGMIAEAITIPGYNGDTIHAYYARPTGEGNYPNLVLIPHMPGWDEWCREAARRFAEHGYRVICPNIYERFGHGTPSEVSERMVAAGIVPDETVMGDTAASLRFLASTPGGNGRNGVIGMCSGGRHTFLAACTVPGIDAAADLWGGGVVASPEQLTPSKPVAPFDYTENLQCPLIGIFGNDDKNPTAEDVDILEAELKKYNKTYEFYRYEGAGHGIWYYHRPMYRQEAAMDSFEKVMAFFEKYLRTEA